MSNSKTNIVKDLEEKSILVSRTFNAPVALIWRAYSESELLDQWWGPSPWRAETKKMDFKAGGSWLYVMVGPQGEKHWAVMEYTEIDTLKKIGIIDAFSDETGVMNTAFPVSKGSFLFTETKEGVLVEFKMKYPTEKDIQTLVEMGFEQGITTGLDQLERLLDVLKSK